MNNLDGGFGQPAHTQPSRHSPQSRRWKSTILATCLVCLVALAAFGAMAIAPALATTTTTPAPTAKMGTNAPATGAQSTRPPLPLQNITPTAQNSEKEAVNLANILLKADLDEIRSLGLSDPLVYARTVFLTPDRSVRGILVKIEHLYTCGTSGCRMVLMVLTDPKNQKFRPVFDTVSEQLYLHNESGSTGYFDIFAEVAAQNADGYGVWRWNRATSTYGFSGRISSASLKGMGVNP